MSSDINIKKVGTLFIHGIPNDVYLSDFRIDGNDELGSMNSISNKIFLSKLQDKYSMLTTVVHEMLHRFYLEYQLQKDDEEKIIESLDSPVTSDIILNKQNNEFFKRILKGDFE